MQFKALLIAALPALASAAAPVYSAPPPAGSTTTATLTTTLVKTISLSKVHVVTSWAHNATTPTPTPTPTPHCSSSTPATILTVPAATTGSPSNVVVPTAKATSKDSGAGSVGINLSLMGLAGAAVVAML